MHMGHFRATVVGNFIKNINIAAGNRVTSINYLGDWGTQFGMFSVYNLKLCLPFKYNASSWFTGMLSLGYKNFGDPQQLKDNPLKHLHSVR